MVAFAFERLQPMIRRAIAGYLCSTMSTISRRSSHSTLDLLLNPSWQLPVQMFPTGDSPRLTHFNLCFENPIRSMLNPRQCHTTRSQASSMQMPVLLFTRTLAHALHIVCSCCIAPLAVQGQDHASTTPELKGEICQAAFAG